MSRIVEKVPGWVERLLFPRLAGIEGELRVLHSEINRVDSRVDSLRNEMMSKFEAAEKTNNSKFESIESKFEGMEAKFEGMEAKFEGLGRRIDALETVMTTKFDAVNARIDGLESRFPAVEEMAEIKYRLSAIEKKVGA